jgi:hypothetical protein
MPLQQLAQVGVAGDGNVGSAFNLGIVITGSAIDRVIDVLKLAHPPRSSVNSNTDTARIMV